MPFVDLYSSDDYASIWYQTNSRYGNVGGFDPDKPTIVMLHPIFLDSSWLDSQFNDPRLNSSYNLIAIDMRVCGKSFARPSALHDSWVDAADLAFVFQSLHLPSSHILALESISTNSALRFAALFPEFCLSLTLCNVPPPAELRWVFATYDEILQSWCFANDIKAFEHAVIEATTFMVGHECDPELQDELIAYWETEMPPCRRQRLVEAMNVLINRTPMRPDALAAITQRVLIVQGEVFESCPLKYAEILAADLVNAEGGAFLYPVRGASGFLNVVPSSASIVNQVFVKFLSRSDPPGRSDLVRPLIPIMDRMQLALDKLSEFLDDPSIADRDPSSSLSFSGVSPELFQKQSETLMYYGQDLVNAFSPLRRDGRPNRKYSERREDHWFHAERDGTSYYNGTPTTAHPSQKLPQQPSHNDKSKREAELAERLDAVFPLPEPKTAVPVRDVKMRKVFFNASSVDNSLHVKSTIKVVNNAGAETITLKHLIT